MAMTTAQIATDFDTTPRTLRKFLRSADSGIDAVGKGARYALPSTKREIAALKKRFAAWDAAQAAKKATKADEGVELENDAQDAPEALDEMTHPLDA